MFQLRANYIIEAQKFLYSQESKEGILEPGICTSTLPTLSSSPPNPKAQQLLLVTSSLEKRMGFHWAKTPVLFNKTYFFNTQKREETQVQASTHQPSFVSEAHRGYSASSKVLVSVEELATYSSLGKTGFCLALWR